MDYELKLDPKVAEILDSIKFDQDNINKVKQSAGSLPTFMDFKVDYAFKYILGHKRILIKLLNDILPLAVEDIEYRPNEIPVISEKEKRSVFDVICQIKGSKEPVIVEMQQVEESDMDDRLVFYGSSLVTKQVKRGDQMYRLRPVYVLCVSAYGRKHTAIIGPNHILFNYRLREPDLNENWSDRLNYYFLELPRLQRAWEKLDTNVQRWCYLFNNLSKFAKVPDDAQGFEDVFNVSRTDELKDSRLIAYMVSMVNEYEKLTIKEYWLNEGVQQTKLQMAKKMKEDQVEPKVIAKYTGLSEEELLQL